MLTTKQKVYLRSLAQKIKPTFQIGKGGLNDNMANDVVNYLIKHELIKISILQNCEEDDDDVIEFFESYGMEFIQKIGRQFIFYMQSDDAKNPIELPRK
ncbi:MAG: YhbY family RNA-binding protein [Acholeplasmatales bacterium]|jgi:RNA-binding protein|nr:YhbY family RNA-binding protein [Acholeplasmatales bacterium]MBR6289538.1 YhbY family RNA-binding protein [Acholeplasmatales bacterium]